MTLEYLVVKWVHVLSSTILFGTGVGSAYYMLVASLHGRPAVAHFVVRHVAIVDATFIATAVVVQPATGLRLAHLAGLPLATPWIAWSIALYFLAGACWLPVLVLQHRMREMARVAVDENLALPLLYRRYLRLWIALGIVAFGALLVVLWLMVARPT